MNKQAKKLKIEKNIAYYPTLRKLPLKNHLLLPHPKILHPCEINSRVLPCHLFQQLLRPIAEPSPLRRTTRFLKAVEGASGGGEGGFAAVAGVVDREAAIISKGGILEVPEMVLDDGVEMMGRHCEFFSELNGWMGKLLG